MAGKRKPITHEQVIDAMKIVVNRQGAAYKYPKDEYNQCHYVRDGKWSCIAGKVFGQLRVVPTANGYIQSNLPIRNLLPILEQGMGIRFTPEAADALAEAQSYQDRGYSWGEALVKGIEAAESTANWRNRHDGVSAGQSPENFFDV